MIARQLKSRAEFSILCGVSRAAVTKACRGALGASIFADKIDISHPSAIEYLANKQTSKTPTPPKKTKKRTTPPPPVKPIAKSKSKGKLKPASHEGEQHYDPNSPIVNLIDLTLQQLVEQYGTDAQLKDWLSARKTIEEIRVKEIDTAKAEGLLVPRELVRLHVFGALENMNKRLLTDAPKTLARRLVAEVKAGSGIPAVEKIVRDIIGTHLKNAKATARRVLRGA